MRVLIVLSVIVVLAASSTGCSFSASSKGSSNSVSKSSNSISDFVSSPFKSSSNSSSPENAYREDVKDFTASYVKSGGNTSQLEQEVGKIAEKHGISDWETNEATYNGIGQGLHKAGLNQAEVDGYKASLADTEQKADWIQEGYND